MCTTSVYTLVYPDGRKERTRRSTCCPHSRHGVPCANNVLFEHPPQMVSYGGSEFPPSPSYTPRSSTPNYRSGDESDRSGRSRRQSTTYNLGGGRVANVTTSGSSSRRERIVLVENPPMARTPPRSHAMPHTAPSSPSTPYILSSSPRRPFIVDERPRSPHVQIDITPASSSRRPSRHVRYASTSSRDSRNSHSEEESSRRRAEREAARQERRRAEDEAHSSAARLAARIARANAEISSRPPVAVPTPPPSASRRQSTYAQRAEDIADSMRGLRLEDEKRRQEEREDEAQRQRLMERMMPRRRATVGPGSRRPRVIYDEGVFRME